MRKLPKSVTVLAWFTIVSVGFSLLAMTFLIDKVMLSDAMGKSAIPIPVQYAIIYIGEMLTIVAGVGILSNTIGLDISM